MTFINFIDPPGGGEPGCAMTWYEAEDTNPGGVVTTVPSNKRAEFMARLSVSGVVDFEEYDFGESAPLSVTANGIGATISDTLGQTSVAGAGSGMFNTTSGGSKLLRTNSSGLMVVTFASPIKAFGMYGTDFGDFNAQWTLKLNKTGGGNVTRDITHTVNGSSGALIFVGFVDGSGTTYDSIEFMAVEFGIDVDNIGIDDLIWDDSVPGC